MLLKELVQVELVDRWRLVILVVLWLLNSIRLLGRRRHLTRHIEAGFREDTSAGAPDGLVTSGLGTGPEHRTLATLFGTHDGLRRDLALLLLHLKNLVDLILKFCPLQGGFRKIRSI